MILDLYDRQQSDQLNYLNGLAPAQETAGFAESYVAHRDAALQARQSTSYLNQRYAVVQDFLDKVYKQTGTELPNPENPDVSAIGVQEPSDILGTNLKGEVDKRLKTIGQNLSYPSEAYIHGEAIKRMSQPIGAERAVEQRPQTLASEVGAFLGGLRGAVTDPVNVLSMALGAGVGSGIVRTAIAEGLINAGSEAVVQAAIYPTLQEADPAHTFAQAAASVAEAGIGGAVIGGGAKAIARAWSAWRGSGVPMPAEIRDAGRVVSRETASASPPPHLQDDIEAGPAHRAAVIETALAGVEQRRPDIPPEVQSVIDGRLGKVITPDGKDVAVRYEVVDAGSLKTSHLDDFRLNPDYPPEFQPRERARAASQTQIQEMAGGLRPELLAPGPRADSGAPIVGADDVVESGNARTMAIRRAYDGGQAEAYRQHLQTLGFDTSGIDRPVLIARRVTPMTDAERQAFTVSANRAGTLQLSATERAMADARLLTPELLRSVDQATLARGFMAGLPAAERGNLATGAGSLSVEGERRLRAALLARAYGAPDLLNRMLEDHDNNIKTIGNALADAAQGFAQMKDAVIEGRIAPGMDITNDLVSAVRLITKARDEGRKFSDLLNQAEMFDGPSEITKLIGRFMFKGGDLKRPTGQAAIASFLREYADEAAENVTDARLFGEPLGARDVMETALRRVKREDLAGLARMTVEDAEKLAADPQVDDAIAAVGRAMADQQASGLRPAGAEPVARDAKIAVADEAGEPIGLSFADAMKEADAEEQAAETIGACIGGTTEPA